MRIYTTSRFERRLKSFLKSRPDLSDKVRGAIADITATPFSRHLKTHKLSGPLKRCLAARITHGYRIIFLLTDDELCFIDIGSHDELYKR